MKFLRRFIENFQLKRKFRIFWFLENGFLRQHVNRKPVKILLIWRDVIHFFYDS